MKNEDPIEVFFEVMLYRDVENRWRASSPVPEIHSSDYGYHEWADVVEAVLDHIKEQTGNLAKKGVRIRVNFIPAVLIEGEPNDYVVPALRPLPHYAKKSDVTARAVWRTGSIAVPGLTQAPAPYECAD